MSEFTTRENLEKLAAWLVHINKVPDSLLLGTYFALKSTIRDIASNTRQRIGLLNNHYVIDVRKGDGGGNWVSAPQDPGKKTTYNCIMCPKYSPVEFTLREGELYQGIVTVGNTFYRINLSSSDFEHPNKEKLIEAINFYRDYKEIFDG